VVAFGQPTKWAPTNEPSAPKLLISAVDAPATLRGSSSGHHRAVPDPGPHAIVDAVAPDGVIDGIEDRRFRFCLSVQWHPEFHIDPGDRRIFDALIAACAP
jgi:gamma-glutamyl-gamma-aminobutyrate hydrolase PuuD